MKKGLILLILLTSFLLIGCDPSTPSDTFSRTPMIPEELKDCPVPTLDNGYNIVWDEEFNYTGLPDSTKWGYDLGVGNGGWGNGESQYYTNRSKNAYVDNGVLSIKAYRENYANSEYTSARILSRNLGDWKYGRMEVRAKLPVGVGTWPAIWMMPTDSVYGGWPRSGEIDIMEAMGRQPNSVLGTFHTEMNYGGNGIGRTIPLANTSTQFHVYSLEWGPDQARIYADDTLITTYNNPKFSADNHKWWPFDQRFYLIMNIAMGGTLGGAIDPNFESAEMQIDYVRVYQNDYTGSDTEKPSVVSLTDWHGSTNAISLSWDDATDNVGIGHYEIVLNGEQIGATNTNHYRIENLNPNEIYQVKLISVDLAGNYSITSNIQVSTAAEQNAPGTLQAENSYQVFNGSLLSPPSGGRAVVLRKTEHGNGYIILEFNVSNAGTYRLNLNAAVARASTELYIYLVNQNGEGTAGTPIALTPTWGIYDAISVQQDFNFVVGKNYLKLEASSDTNGDIISIDYIEVATK